MTTRRGARAGSAILIGLLAGCAGNAGAPQYVEPSSCPPVTTGATVSGTLPADFTAVTVRRCTFTVLLVPEARPDPTQETSDGGWVWESVQRASGSLDPLVQALRLPPQKPDDDSVVCPAIATAPITIALTDNAGRTAIPAIPATTCGMPLPEVTDALDALSWTTLETRAGPAPSPSR